MAEIIRHRTIRPSTRLATSSKYKINIEGISEEDILIVKIDHETKSFNQTFKFYGSDLIGRKSIHFKVLEVPSVQIKWVGITPQHSTTNSPIEKSLPSKQKLPIKKIFNDPSSSDIKTSLSPIENSSIQILILGTLPGEISLKLQEYYAHPRNRFWKIISVVTNQHLPSLYSERKTFLIKNRIGLWDVLHSASRMGSLDSRIRNGIPNDLEIFIKQHKNLKVIGFNGKESEKQYDRFFLRNKKIRYISLPSTSPANSNLHMEEIILRWQEINFGKIFD